MQSVIVWVVLPLALAAVPYAVLVGGYYFIQHRPGMALAFAGYVIANAGLIWDALTFK